MKNARRNRRLFWFFTGTYLALSVALVWVIAEAFEWRGRALGLAAAMSAFWVCYFISSLNDRRRLDRLESELRASGVAVSDEGPEPIKFAQNRASLIASIIALVLIAAVFIAYHTGWLERVGFLPKP